MYQIEDEIIRDSMMFLRGIKIFRGHRFAFTKNSGKKIDN